MKKYRKKPVEVEAIHLVPSMRNKICDWINTNGGEAWFYASNGEAELYIKTLEGTMVGSHGDYIIKGVKGEFYPCKPDIFEAAYEEVV